MSNSIFKAVVNTLAKHLRDAPALMPDVEIVSGWQEPDIEQPKTGVYAKSTVSVHLLTAPREVDVSINTVPLASRELSPPSATHKDYLWSLGFFDIELQVDVFCKYEAQLDALDSRLVVEFRRGNLMRPGGNPVDSFLVLPLVDDIHLGSVTYLFDGAEMMPTADKNNRREWRASYACQASVEMATWAPTPRVARITMRSKIGPSLTDEAFVDTHIS